MGHIDFVCSNLSGETFMGVQLESNLYCIALYCFDSKLEKQIQ